MANIPQRDPESGAADQGHYTPTRGNSEPYADIDRSISGSKPPPFTSQITSPMNFVSDSPWGVNDYAGGLKDCETPSIPVTKGE